MDEAGVWTALGGGRPRSGRITAVMPHRPSHVGRIRVTVNPRHGECDRESDAELGGCCDRPIGRTVALSGMLPLQIPW
jgi:hypothetical protein